MSAEIICVGTELLLGDILNSNAQYLAKQLASLGIPHYNQTVVGDNPERIKQVIEIASTRASILIFTGGLGPTPDDLTTETIAEFFGVPLVEHPEVIEDITQKYARRGRVMTVSNRKQALQPQGADVLPNPLGTAPGMIWQPRPGLTILTFPGVPREMYRMWSDTAIPYLKSQGWGEKVIYSRMLRFWGVAESVLAEKVGELLNSTNPTVAPYAGKGEVKLRVAAYAASEAEAMAQITPIEAQIKAIAGLDFYGADGDSLASVVGNLLTEAKQTLSVAESCTGGGLGQLLTTISGSSDYFQGGVISYDNQVKISVLEVNPQDLNQFGAVSPQVAEQMALGVKKLLKTDWALSITGVAGPTGSTETKPVGLVYIGLASPDASLKTFSYNLGVEQDREWIRQLSSCHALDRLRRQLLLSSKAK
ncbi:competence/damage-inducible protein A [Merismopedia glauca]|uniref:CinA-like protein n=1 Tax=Merismopedia glauca CCAP 1448/3 TaxID=1296344 RepID=A0A2T1C0X5_9CYAN|nr:competence/damage-inducible protein A [Merismopedia glauca]PSB01892.1 competence/damage-inducible protein A [Merismopedia glauca CCAP 1448/3]